MLVENTALKAFVARARSLHLLRLTPDGTIVECNDAAVRHFGVPANEILGRHARDFLTGADAQRFESELRTSGQRTEPILLNFCDATRQPYTLECWLDVDDGGALVFGEPPLEDEVRLQRDLLGVTQDLALLSRERARLAESERRARLDADAANREKDRAIATIAHELRQPLGPIRFAVELLARGAPDAARDRALRTLERQATQLTRLVEDLLDAARLRENKLALARAPLDLTLFLGDVAEALRAKIASTDVRMECTLPRARLWVDADAARLGQVFSNLVDNAVKYTKPSGRIALTATSDASLASVSIRDTGRGIPAETLPRVFEMFAQHADGERGGLGIGLAVAAGIVKLHGGAIEARSAGLGQGAEFIVRLPIIATPGASTESLAPGGLSS